MPILEFVANSHPAAWLLFADLYDELARPGDLERAKQAVLKYLEVVPSDAPDRFLAWQRLARIARNMNDALTEVHALVELSQDKDVPFSVLSDSANAINNRFRDGESQLHGEEKFILVRKLIAVIVARQKEADAAALSRLAWLCLHVKDDDAARTYTRRGLQIDPMNTHCRKLAVRLHMAPT